MGLRGRVPVGLARGSRALARPGTGAARIRPRSPRWRKLPRRESPSTPARRRRGQARWRAARLRATERQSIAASRSPTTTTEAPTARSPSRLSASAIPATAATGTQADSRASLRQRPPAAAKATQATPESAIRQANGLFPLALRTPAARRQAPVSRGRRRSGRAGRARRRPRSAARRRARGCPRRRRRVPGRWPTGRGRRAAAGPPPSPRPRRAVGCARLSRPRAPPSRRRGSRDRRAAIASHMERSETDRERAAQQQRAREDPLARPCSATATARPPAAAPATGSRRTPKRNRASPSRGSLIGSRDVS